MALPLQNTTAPQTGLRVGLPPEYSDTLFKNIQLAGQNTNNARRQQVVDNNSGFGQGAALRQGLADSDRQTADATLQAATGAQLQGVQEGLTDRRAQQARDFTASETAAQRAHETDSLKKNLDWQNFMFGNERNDTHLNSNINALAGGGGALYKTLMNLIPAV